LPAQAEEPALATTVTQATEAFRSAAATEGVAARAEAFRRAAEQFETVTARGHANGSLEYNTANAWLLAGDLGRAVLHYRRGLVLRPGDPEIEANLATARARRLDQIDDASGRALVETLFFWHHGLDRPTKRTVAAALWLLGFALLAAVFLLPPGDRRIRFRRLAALTCLALAAALYVSLAVERADAAARDDAVLVADEMPLRTGDGFGYPARYENPIHAGAELIVLEDRGGWVRVELADGKSGWLPVDALERV
jgi:hypothetical protein